MIMCWYKCQERSLNPPWCQRSCIEPLHSSSGSMPPPSPHWVTESVPLQSQLGLGLDLPSGLNSPLEQGQATLIKSSHLPPPGLALYPVSPGGIFLAIFWNEKWVKTFSWLSSIWTRSSVAPTRPSWHGSMGPIWSTWRLMLLVNQTRLSNSSIRCGPYLLLTSHASIGTKLLLLATGQLANLGNLCAYW